MNIYVDLDGTLVKSDLLWEAVFGLIQQHWTSLFTLASWLIQGKVAFKHLVFARLNADFEHLPFTEDFLDYLCDQKRRGRRIILATGNSKSVAEAVAQRLPIIDEILATESANNTGETKLLRIREHCGAQPFAYAGNALIDQPILAAAAEPILVNPSPALLRLWRDRTPRIFGDQRQARIQPLLEAMEIGGWTHNLAIFAALLLGYFDLGSLLRLSAGFLALCLLSSAAEVLAALLSVARDRRSHHTRGKPFASGRLPMNFGCGAMIVLFLAGFTWAWWLSFYFALACLVYAVAKVIDSSLTGDVSRPLRAAGVGLLCVVRILAGVAVLE